MTTLRRRQALSIFIAVAALTQRLVAPSISQASAAALGIAGTVRADAGSALVGTVVGLIDSETGTLAAKTATGKFGEYRFESVRPGRYRLAVAVAESSFSSASYVATLAAAHGGETRVDWTLHSANAPQQDPHDSIAQSSTTVAGVVAHPEPSTALAQPAFVADVPTWVLATAATGGVAGATLGSLCLTGTAICEEDKPVASPQQ